MQSKEALINLKIKTLDNNIHIFRISLSSTIEELKSMLEKVWLFLELINYLYNKKLSIPKLRQRIIF